MTWDDPTSPRTLQQLPLGENPRFALGQVVARTYEIKRLLGAGGMGQVFEAIDLILKRVVAIKAARPGSEPDGLLLEAQALAAVRHPGVVAVYSFGYEDGVEFFAMERVYGVSLLDLLFQRVRGGGSLAVSEVLDFLISVADALAAVHRAGLVHRDLTAANVLVTPGGRVIVIDFGVFAPQYTFGEDHTLSGTPQYMAPEAIRQDVHTGGGPLVDIYALGILSYQLLAGTLPFDDEMVPVILRHQLADEPPPLLERRPDTPPALAALVATMLRKDPAERPGTVDDVLWRLREIRQIHVAGGGVAPFSVLIVDDDEDLRNAAELYVRRAVPSARVTTIADGAAAMQAVAKAPPDLMLLDLDMPGTNGVEVCMYLRGAELAARVSIVVMAGQLSASDRALLGELGVARLLRKDRDLWKDLTAVVLEAARHRGVGDAAAARR